MALALQIARFHVKTAYNGHHPIKLPKLKLGEVGYRLVIHLVSLSDDQTAFWCQQTQSVLGVRHGSNLVALGRRCMSRTHRNPRPTPVLAHPAFALSASKRHSYDMLRFLLRLVVNSFALGIAVWIVPGLTMRAYAEGEPVIAGGPSLELLLSYLFIAFVFGLINGIVGNAIRIVAFPLYVITLGLIALVVNGLLLLLVNQISLWLTFGLFVEDFYWGVVGALVLSLSSWIIGMLLRPLMKKKR